MSEMCIADIMTRCGNDGCEQSEMDGLEYFTYYKSIDQRCCCDECFMEAAFDGWKIRFEKKPENGERYQWVATSPKTTFEFCRATPDEAADALLTYLENQP